MATQQYREVKRKAAVGERIKIVAASYTMGRYDNGDEFTVNHVDRDDDVYVRIDGKDRLICLSEFVVLEPIAQPIAPSPLGTSFLSSDPLYAAFRQFVADNAVELRKLLPEIDPPGISVGGIVGAPFTVADSGAVIARKPKPPTRAQAIAKATADVAELLRAVWSMDVDFHVNRDKRAVTALVKRGGALFAKFTAKCSPADVFHAEIGKAISLRKALGLAVPTEYTDAPQPEKAEIGAVVEKTALCFEGEKGSVVSYFASGAWFASVSGKGAQGDGRIWSDLENLRILDDTDVDYSVNADSAVPAKGVAA
ncbi:hypothetical protein [Paenibacillus odorifer]|uniref:hypothetical protein n=1 Tax=Paenibacillus odorifer TaxID=189426 RepID=UPI00096D26A6|nr:hypothetical protein [Paenibacillus odorifer]OMD16238.1 hypothetical protein BJP50_18550 [Paenibacillus odorifer]